MSGSVVFWNPNDEGLNILNETSPEGIVIEWIDSNTPTSTAAEALSETAVVILGGEIPFSVELASKCPNLRLIQSTSAGTNQLDKVGLGELGIDVSNNGGGNAVSVAEHTITLMVSVFRKFQLQFERVKEREWMGEIRSKWMPQAFEIEGKTVGIIGLGRIGSRVAKRLQGWDCNIIYDDVVEPDPDMVQRLGLKKVSREELLKTADIITLHVPLNDQTRGMISDQEFEMMKPTAVLINACRGPVVDEGALIRAMESNKIMAAGVDVLEVEPAIKDNPLLEMDNVLVTPHLAGWTQEAWEKSRAFATYNAGRVVEGNTPESIVQPNELMTGQSYFKD